MKKTIKMMLALMAGAVAFTACSNDDEILVNPNGQQATSLLKPMTFTAFQEGQGSTQRAAIDGKDIEWVSGDEISIFDGSSENNGDQKFTLTDGAGTTTGTFSGSAATASTYYALYPYTASSMEVTLEMAKEAVKGHTLNFEGCKELIGYDDGENALIEEMNKQGISAENQAIILAYLKEEPIKGVQRNGSDQFEDAIIPAEQTATAGTADTKAMLMIGKTSDKTSLQFKNVCAFVKVKPMFDCTSITLSSVGTENLAGTVTLDYNSGAPTATVTANGTNEVVLSGTITAENTYYIAVLPATLASGFSIKFQTSTDEYVRTASKSVTLARNKVLNLGTFTTDGPWDTTGKAYATTPDCYVKWIQLWKDGPKFAEYNIGASKAEEYGNYFTWGGISPNGDDIEWKDDHNTGSADLSGDNDTATKLWGENWRMPTKGEIEDLFNSENCTATWVEDYNGSNIGLLVTGLAGTAYENNSVFFPAAGCCDEGYVWNDGVIGVYWSSTPYEYDGDYADAMYFRDSGSKGLSNDNRIKGWSVRAVLNEE